MRMRVLVAAVVLTWGAGGAAAAGPPIGAARGGGVSPAPQRCFGALGDDCGIPAGPLAGAGGPPCTRTGVNPGRGPTGICSINAGSWDHDECCWLRDGDGQGCASGRLDDRVALHLGRACSDAWMKAITHLRLGLVWQRAVVLERLNGSGRVAHAEYCAPAGVLMLAADAAKCCSRTTIAVPGNRPVPPALSALAAALRICR
jgi:hypothetical protein